MSNRNRLGTEGWLIGWLAGSTQLNVRQEIITLDQTAGLPVTGRTRAPQGIGSILGNHVVMIVRGTLYADRSGRIE